MLRNCVLLTVSIIAVVAFSSCHAPPISRGFVQVGGGPVISYKAGQAGTLLVVEVNSKKILVTYSIEAGQTYSFVQMSQLADDILRAAFGGDVPKNVSFALYFAPVMPRDQP